MIQDTEMNDRDGFPGDEDFALEEHATKIPISDKLRQFFTGLLFKCILWAVVLHVVLILLTSIGMFFAEEETDSNKGGKEKSVASEKSGKAERGKKAESDVKEKGDHKQQSDNNDANADVDEDSQEKESEDEAGKNKDDEKETVDKTQPTGNPEDYQKRLETITPDKAPENPLDTTNDEDDLP